MIEVDRTLAVMAKITDSVRDRFPSNIVFSAEREEDDPPSAVLLIRRPDDQAPFFAQLSVWENGKVAAIAIDDGPPWLNESFDTNLEEMPLRIGQFVRVCMDHLGGKEAEPEPENPGLAAAAARALLKEVEKEAPSDSLRWKTVCADSNKDGDIASTTERLAVPGGWLYTRIDVAGGAFTSVMVFVPETEE